MRKELCNLYSSPDIWNNDDDMGEYDEIRKAYRILVSRHQGKRSRNDNIKMYFKEIGWVLDSYGSNRNL
jgi:hypothetical protein